MTDFAIALEQAMLEAGFRIKGTIDFNRLDSIQRFQDALKPKGKDIFVILHGLRGATFGSWHDKDHWITWWADSKRTYLPTREQVYERAMQKLAMEERANHMRQMAIRRATNFWYNHPVRLVDDYAPSHPYVRKKRITPYYSKAIKRERWIREVLILPIRDINYELQSVQVIKANGFKRCWKGTTYKDNMIWLSYPLPLAYKGIIYVCEGYATACTIYQASGKPTICALNAGNLLSVCFQLRRKYPNACVKIAADNDFTKQENTGLRVGREVAIRVGISLHYPIFHGLCVEGHPSDFNDLAALTDMECVKKQLLLIRPTK